MERRNPVTEAASTGPSVQPEDDTSTNIVCDTSSPPDVETDAEVEISDSEGDTKILNVNEEKDEDQARPNLGQIHVALARPNPEPMHEDFIATVYPKVYEILKHTTEEHVFLENQPSSFETLSSMKNQDDVFTYGDQLLYDRPMKEELDKANMETEVESIVTVPIHQSFSTSPLFSTPFIDVTQPKPVSPPIQEPIFTDTTTTTTTTLPPPLLP
nr:hypothetical protein [Tanacetum cinerariifolium]